MHHQRILSVFPQAEHKFHYLLSALFCPNILGFPFLGFQIIVSLLLGRCSSSKLADSAAAAITYKTVLNNPVAPLIDPSNELMQLPPHLGASEPLSMTHVFVPLMNQRF